MSARKEFGDQAWESFFEFLYPAAETLTPAEVDRELEERGIDVKPALARVRNALRAAEARVLLEPKP